MAMCVYKYVFNKHVIGCGGGEWSGVDSGIYYRGRPVFARGRGAAYVPSGSKAVPKGGGARTESSCSFCELGI